MRCTNCRLEVSNDIFICPKCGNTITNIDFNIIEAEDKNDTNWALFLLAYLSVFLLTVGCGFMLLKLMYGGYQPFVALPCIIIGTIILRKLFEKIDYYFRKVKYVKIAKNISMGLAMVVLMYYIYR